MPSVLREGRYELGSQLGQGGMATVFRARDRTLGVQRAIKMLRPEHSDASDFRDRLRSEAQAMARLEHPNILPILDVGTEGEYFYVVMPLADRGSLQDLLKDKGPLAWGEATRCIVQVLAALSNAHTLDVVHRDVKPQNILVGSRGQAMLADFGIAMLADSQGPDRNTITGVAMGSPSFMPPEQRVDARSVDHRADIYSAGATFYAMITCRTPVDLYTAKPDSSRWRDVPEPFVEVIRKATAMQPEERYQSALEMATAILAASEAAGTQPSGLAGAMEGPSGEQIFMTADSLPDALTRVYHDPEPRNANPGRSVSSIVRGSRKAGNRRGMLVAVMVAGFLLTASITTGLLTARAAGLLPLPADGGDEVASEREVVPHVVPDGPVSMGSAEAPVAPVEAASEVGEAGSNDALADASLDILADIEPGGENTVEAKSSDGSGTAVEAAPSSVSTAASERTEPAPPKEAPALGAQPPEGVQPDLEVTPVAAPGVKGKGGVGALFREWTSVGAGRLARLSVSGEPATVTATFTTVKGSAKVTRSLAGSWDAGTGVLTMKDVESPEDGVYSLTLSPDGKRLSGVFQPPSGMPRLLSLVPAG